MLVGLLDRRAAGGFVLDAVEVSPQDHGLDLDSSLVHEVHYHSWGHVAGGEGHGAVVEVLPMGSGISHYAIEKVGGLDAVVAALEDFGLGCHEVESVIRDVGPDAAVLVGSMNCGLGLHALV